MKRISIWFVVFIIAFTCTGMAVASEQVFYEGEGYFEPTILSTEPLQEPYVQALDSAGTTQSEHSITVIPNSSEYPHITLTVSIFDENGYSVGGLTADDFIVFEQSTAESVAVAEELTCFHETVSSESGISFAFAVDVSESMMGSELREAKVAAEEFIANSSETDRGALISFSSGGTERTVFSVNNVNTDADGDGTLDIVEAVNGLTPSGMTALFDGMALAIDNLAQEPSPKALIVFSDGDTNDDKRHDINSLIEKATNEGVMIYPIGFCKSSTILEDIAELTGGKCYYATNSLDMAEIYDTVAGSIAGFAYTLCYSTHNPALDGTTRTVTVEDGSGSGTGFYTVGSTNAPVITHTPVNGTLEFFTVTVQADVTDPDPGDVIDDVILYYRQYTSNPTAPFMSVNMINTDTEIWVGHIPADEVVVPSLDYFICAWDSQGAQADHGTAEEPHVIQVYASGQPTASAGNDMTVEEGALVTLDGTGSTDPDRGMGDTLTFEWTQVEGISVELANASGSQPEFIAPQVGPEGASLTFMLTATDAGGAESTDTVTISVTDSAPEAAFSWSPENPTPGEAVEFTDISVASVDDIVSRVWEIGEDGTGDGVTTSYTFERAGTYSVTLTLTDSDGSMDSATRSITIESCPNGDCDPGGGCFISESFRQGDNVTSGMSILFVVLSLFCAGFGAAIVYKRINQPARVRGNRIRFTLFANMILAVILLTVSQDLQAGMTDEESGAFIRQGAVTLSPMVGGYMFDSKQDIEEGPIFGLGLGYNFTENWAVQLSGHFGQFDHPYWDCDTCACVEEDVDALVLQADLIYHLSPESRFVPYLAAGAGYVDIDPYSSGDDSSGTLNYGGGIKYFLTRNLALKADVRHIYWFEGSMSNMMANVGLEFQFGGSRQEPAVVRPVQEPEPPPAPVAPEPVKKEVQPAAETAEPEPITLVLRIKFEFDSAKVDSAYHDEIKQAAQLLNEHPGVDAMIEGHTCNIGTETYNMALSRRRAESVKAYMINHFNVDGARLSASGYGESRPDHDNATLEGRRLNRRVVIRLEGE